MVLKHWSAEDGESRYVFFCPGCKCGHSVWMAHSPGRPGPVWEFNGNVDKPTFTPSLLVRMSVPQDKDGSKVEDLVKVCHSYVKDGTIQFLADSTHAMAGQTVPLPDW